MGVSRVVLFDLLRRKKPEAVIKPTNVLRIRGTEARQLAGLALKLRKQETWVRIQTSIS
jgi:hypothetical protein